VELIFWPLRPDSYWYSFVFYVPFAFLFFSVVGFMWFFFVVWIICRFVALAMNRCGLATWLSVPVGFFLGSPGSPD